MGRISQWVRLLTRVWSVISSSPIKGSCCFLEQETQPLMLSTGWVPGLDCSMIYISKIVLFHNLR